MFRVAPVVLLIAVSGCSTLVPRTADIGPSGQTLRVIAAGGGESRMHFRSDGQVTATFDGGSLTGEWNMQDEGLCFRWPQTEVECWPYANGFARGRTVTVTSTRGNTVRVTRL